MASTTTRRTRGRSEVQQLPLFPPEPVPAQPEMSPLAAAVVEFLAHLARLGRAQHTLAAARLDLAQLVEGVASRAPGEVSTAELQRFVQRLRREQDNRPASLRRKIATIKAFFRYQVQIGELESDPASTVPYPDLPERPVEPLSPREIRRVIEAADVAGHRALILLMLEAGLKREEALSLRPSDLLLHDADGGALMVQRAAQAKRVRARTVPLTPRLVTALRSLVEAIGPDAPLFNLSTRGLDWIVREAGRRAALRPAGHLTPQRLRDTFAVSWLVAQPAADPDERGGGQSGRELAELLGIAPNSHQIVRYRQAARHYGSPASESRAPDQGLDAFEPAAARPE